jgi:hypothetical protein
MSTYKTSISKCQFQNVNLQNVYFQNANLKKVDLKMSTYKMPDKSWEGSQNFITKIIHLVAAQLVALVFPDLFGRWRRVVAQMDPVRSVGGLHALHVVGQVVDLLALPFLDCRTTMCQCYGQYVFSAIFTTFRQKFGDFHHFSAKIWRFSPFFGKHLAIFTIFRQKFDDFLEKQLPKCFLPINSTTCSQNLYIWPHCC